MTRRPEMAIKDTYHASTDEALLRRLRAGETAAFTELVRKHQDSMLRLAGFHVPSRAIAEEVVQETWTAVLEGLPRFEGRSSLKTWIYAILINRAKSLGVRERRSVPFSALGQRDGASPTEGGAGEAVRLAHGAPAAQVEERTPERSLQLRQAVREVTRGMAELPEAQREVVTLMGVWGRSADETCRQLKISPANQRVLLHRGRARLRRAVAALAA